MPIISFIPKRYENGFKLLASQGDEAFTSLKEGLNEVPLSSSTEKLASKIANSKNLNGEEIQEIFSSVGGLMSFLNEEEDIEELVNDVVVLKEDELKKENKVELLRERLLFLIKNKKVYYASKAEDLITETENLFLACRIVTDMRPVFNINPEEAPEAGIIIHNLHFHYQGNLTSVHQDLYLSLDSNDIQVLMEALIRAERKDESLRALLKNFKMEDLND